MTNPNGSVTDERYQNGQPVQITAADGTSDATTETLTYNAEEELVTKTDGDGHSTTYAYDSAGNKTSETNADSDSIHWTYDGLHDITSTTTPEGETTTYELDSHGNRLSESRPAPGSTTQTTSYTYNSHGEQTSKTDPDGHTWTYGYDSHGDKTSETDPNGDETTYTYDADSRKTSETKPAGNVSGAEAAKYTTTYTLDDRGRVTKEEDGLGHTTTHAYDGDDNITDVTDPEGNETHTTYDADGEPTKITNADSSTEETGYDAEGKVISQTNGDSKTTKYTRNYLEQETAVEDPLHRTTTKTYDAAGNLVTVTDPEGRTTTYSYDFANRLKEVSYSDGTTPTVKYEYDADGARTSMTDGSGTTSYTYDQLGRLTQSKDGHGDVTKYEYDLANNQTGITYPSGETVHRTFDATERLASVEDWLGHTTSFSYTPDSSLKTITFPSGTHNTDEYGYNADDQMTSFTALGEGSATIASVNYTRNADGQVATETPDGLPGSSQTDTYDQRKRLTEAGSEKFAYDAANSATTIRGKAATYDAAGELEEGAGAKYTYNELGERTKTTPESGPATTYGYDQAGNLTSMERTAEGSTPEIKDTYAYNGDGLRTAQTKSGTTSYLAWDLAEKLPLILNDGTNNYIYGPGGLPIEQIDSAGTPLYYHHDQQGSTRLLTTSTGTVAGTATYDAYGKVSGTTGTTTPLGYDGQYTDSDTGLIYLRARTYDPATAQFLSVNPAVEITLAPYSYAGDSPLTEGDPSGRYETNAQESEFAHAFLRRWARLEKQQFAYLPTSLSEDLQELKVYEFDVGLYDRTEDEELKEHDTLSCTSSSRLFTRLSFLN